MNDVIEEAAPSQKRKTSPLPSSEDGAAKRLKTDQQHNGHASDSDGDGNGAAASAAPDAIPDEPAVNGSEAPRTDDKKEEPASCPAQSAEAAPDSAPPDRASDAEIARRHAETPRPSVSAPPPPPPPGRKNLSQEEKRRGQRLFGGLLSTLSQTTAGSQQHKRRLEIERRQQERAEQQRAEDDKRRAARLARLNSVRRIEQVKFDEQVMKTRHSNMLAMAHSLRTKAEPHLYYRPWDLTEEQERLVKDQTKEAEKTIEREAREFKRRKEERLKALGAAVSAPSRPDAPVREPTPSEDTNPEPAVKAPAHDNNNDENGDEIVQDKEDTVLY